MPSLDERGARVFTEESGGIISLPGCLYHCQTFLSSNGTSHTYLLVSDAYNFWAWPLNYPCWQGFQTLI